MKIFKDYEAMDKRKSLWVQTASEIVSHATTSSSAKKAQMHTRKASEGLCLLLE